MSDKLDKLNRLRANAGQSPLKSWKASGAKLDEAIKNLESKGFIDVLPGANVTAKPITDDPVVKKNLEESEEKKPEEKVTKVKPALARGIDTPDGYTRHSRDTVKDLNQAERKKKKLKLSDEDKEQIKDEAKARGAVDPKKDPDKAARQKKHIEDKQAKRKAEGKEAKPREVGKDQVTIADLARELGLEPKVVRNKLRRPKYQEEVDKLRLSPSEWVFPKSARDKLLKMIKGS